RGGSAGWRRVVARFLDGALLQDILSIKNSSYTKTNIMHNSTDAELVESVRQSPSRKKYWFISKLHHVLIPNIKNFRTAYIKPFVNTLSPRPKISSLLHLLQLYDQTSTKAASLSQLAFHHFSPHLYRDFYHNLKSQPLVAQ